MLWRSYFTITMRCIMIILPLIYLFINIRKCESLPSRQVSTNIHCISKSSRALIHWHTDPDQEDAAIDSSLTRSLFSAVTIFPLFFLRHLYFCFCFVCFLFYFFLPCLYLTWFLGLGIISKSHIHLKAEFQDHEKISKTDKFRPNIGEGFAHSKKNQYPNPNPNPSSLAEVAIFPLTTNKLYKYDSLMFSAHNTHRKGE